MWYYYCLARFSIPKAAANEVEQGKETHNVLKPCLVFCFSERGLGERQQKLIILQCVVLVSARYLNHFLQNQNYWNPKGCTSIICMHTWLPPVSFPKYNHYFTFLQFLAITLFFCFYITYDSLVPDICQANIYLFFLKCSQEFHIASVDIIFIMCPFFAYDGSIYE